MRLTLLLLLPVLALPAQNSLAQNPNVPIENEYVRVVLATDQPAAKPGALHEHKQNRVMIYLSAGDMQIKYANGQVDNQHWKAGDVAWSAANGMHTSQNVSSNPIHIVEIEVRSAGGGSAAPGGGNRAILINNPQVLVYRGSKPPAGKHFVAVDDKTGSALWDKMPDGAGPFVITELK
ncbi:MAG: hypothetical protein ABSB15_20955 [Bryobacteraceae bacterium]|jgi:uncharacterized RmlC-like cupin family protein